MSLGSDAGGDGRTVTRSEEELLVTVRRRPTEVVRFTKRIATEERTITVSVRREELVEERTPVDTTASDPVPSEHHERPTEHVFVLSEEEVTVSKRVVPRERVRVWVETATEHRTVEAKLRKEVVDTDLAEAGAGDVT